MDESMKGVEIMKRKKMLVMATVFAMLFGLAQIALASIPIPNHFVSTSSESNIFNSFGQLNTGWFFGIYDFGGNPSSGLNLLEGGGPDYYANFEVTQPGGSGTSWMITITNGTYQGDSLNIGDSKDFSFYFRNNDGSIYDTDPGITGGYFNYGFSSNDGGRIVGADLNPVPLPGSAIFLFSGIMGLVAFGSRRKIMK